MLKWRKYELAGLKGDNTLLAGACPREDWEL